MDIAAFVAKIIDIVLHVDQYLGFIVSQYGIWTYMLLFLVIFLETGLVFTPFLPGDSLIFASATMAGAGIFNIWILFIVFFAAAVLGDTCNYWIGRFIGLRLFHEKSRWLKKKYLTDTQKFFDKYGPSTIILARFIPIIRTFAPFLAGVGRMNYWKFFLYNVVGGLVWVGLFTAGGYYFGGMQFVQDNFTLVLLFIIAISFVPAIWHVIKYAMQKYRRRARD